MRSRVEAVKAPAYEASSGRKLLRLHRNTSVHAGSNMTEKANDIAVQVAIGWYSRDAHHVDRMHLPALDLQRARLPGDLRRWLVQAGWGEETRVPFGCGELVPARAPGERRIIPCKEIAACARFARGMVLRHGRFYPRRVLAGITGFDGHDPRPFRFLRSGGSDCVADLNHPLADVAIEFHLRRLRRSSADARRAATDIDVVRSVCDGGPGLQAGAANVETEFYTHDAFTRRDEESDETFYAQPRLVNHLDTTAMAQVRTVYRHHLAPGMRVLDLMSSWNSHLPEGMPGLRVTGLGLNAEEMARNPRLARCVVHDLNRCPRLPFAAASFDAAICTVSVEYLVRPIEVCMEIARVLRAGAPFVLTFSERWFPPKVVRVWVELHPFERMGLVLDYLRRTHRFAELGTLSLRGLPRPAGDKYAARLTRSDPIYAVWGSVVGRS